MRPKELLKLMVTGFGVASMSACLSGPGFFKQDGNGPPPQTFLEVENLGKGGVKATVLADTTQTQVIRPTQGSGVEHSEVAFPPGSLAVDSAVTVEKGAPIVSDTTAQKLGMDNGNKLASNQSAVLVQSEKKQNAAKPFTIALETPKSENELGLKEGAYEVVVYKVEDAETGALELGLVPTDALTYKANKVVVETTRFGVFQAALSGEKIESLVKTETTVPISAANDRDDSFEIADVTPYVAPAGETVTLSGNNFRETMTIAMGGSSVGGLIVESEQKARFTVPKETPFGFAELRASQGDTTRELMLFAQAEKDELPLITMDPSGVCKGVNYYDANGNKQTVA